MITILFADYHPPGGRATICGNQMKRTHNDTVHPPTKRLRVDHQRLGSGDPCHINNLLRELMEPPGPRENNHYMDDLSQPINVPPYEPLLYGDTCRGSAIAAGGASTHCI